MGLLGGTKTTTTTSTPWEPQGTALKDIFNKAGALYENKAGTPFYEGDLYANMDPQTAEAIKGMLSYVQSKGAANADMVTQAGQQLVNPNAFNGAISAYSDASRIDPTQANIKSATAYANNPAVDGMIDAASRDVRRNLYEGALPGIDRAASGSGNINSTRAGVAQGIAMRGAQDQIGDISANIRGAAYDRGLGLAEQARSTNLGAMGNAAGLYGQATGQGLDAITKGNSLAIGNMGTAIDASQLFQKDAQGQIDADFARWQGNDTRDMDLLSKYYSIIGSNNWGGTQTTKEKSSGSILGSILGVASTAAGLGAFSDRRLKTNIKKVGEMADGLGVYTYDYVWGQSASGVMADEVASLRPWALGPTVAGFRTVNYAAL